MISPIFPRSSKPPPKSVAFILPFLWREGWIYIQHTSNRHTYPSNIHPKGYLCYKFTFRFDLQLNFSFQDWMDLKRQASEIISKQVRRLGAFPTFNGMRDRLYIVIGIRCNIYIRIYIYRRYIYILQWTNKDKEMITDMIEMMKQQGTCYWDFLDWISTGSRTGRLRPKTSQVCEGVRILFLFCQEGYVFQLFFEYGRIFHICHICILWIYSLQFSQGDTR